VASALRGEEVTRATRHERHRASGRRGAIVVALSLVISIAAASAMSCTRTVDLDVPDANTNTGADSAISHDAQQSDDGGLGDSGIAPPDGSSGDASLPDAL
jgi:hypothetical protein